MRYKRKTKQNIKKFGCTFMPKRMECAQESRDDRIVDFYYPILSCFRKMISVSDLNLVLIEIMLSESKNYPKLYCDAQHILFVLCLFCLKAILHCEAEELLELFCL